MIKKQVLDPVKSPFYASYSAYYGWHIFFKPEIHSKALIFKR